MEKFCGKCGAKLHKKTEKCPKCDKEKKKPKKIFKKIIIFILLLILASAGTIGFMVYKGKLDIPFVNKIFVALNLKDKGTSAPNDENKNTGDNNDADIPTNTEEENDLGDNYEVPEFDAEKHFNENTTLKDSFDVTTSHNISTEAKAYENFKSRGFTDVEILYDYLIDGTYLSDKEITKNSSEQHPMYKAYYATTSGDIWMIYEINGSYFAMPVTYNFANEDKVNVMISETDTITSYDNTTNKFYVNIPDESKNIIKKVDKINKETIDKLTSEEIDKL